MRVMERGGDRGFGGFESALMMNSISLPSLTWKPKSAPRSLFLPAEARCPIDGKSLSGALQRQGEWRWQSPGKIHLYQPQKRPLFSSLEFGAKRRWVERNPIISWRLVLLPERNSEVKQFSWKRPNKYLGCGDEIASKNIQARDSRNIFPTDIAFPTRWERSSCN